MVNFYISNPLGQNFSKFRDSYSEIIVAQALDFNEKRLHWASVVRDAKGTPFLCTFLLLKLVWLQWSMFVVFLIRLLDIGEALVLLL